MKKFIKKHPKLKKVVKEIINISKLPILIPTGLVMNIRKKIYTPRMKQSDSIGVLGRGVSLAQAGRLNFLKDFIIVNTIPKELKTEPIRSLLKGKRIIHMVNIGEGVLPAYYLLKYNIYKYVISRLKPDGPNLWIRSPRKIYRTEKFGFKTEFLPEEIVPYLKKGFGAGGMAIIYAAVALKKKNVYVAGMDFYETDYLTGPLKPEGFDDLKREPKIMMGHVTNLIAKCPETNFHFITASSFKCSLPNVRVYNYNIKP